MEQTDLTMGYWMTVMLWTGVAGTVFSILMRVLPFEGVTKAVYVPIALLVGYVAIRKANNYLQSDRVLP